MQLSFGIEPALYLAGYQGRDLDAFVRLVVKHGIVQVIDVRERPTSRRPGFAKTPLSRALEHANVGYVHVREAGNPFRHEGTGRDAVLARYAEHVAAHPEIVARVAALAKAKTSLLLCFERDPADCHRSILGARVAEAAQLKLVSL